MTPPLSLLTPAERRAVALRALGLSRAEAAYALGVTEGTMRSYMTHARRVTRLRTIPLCLAYIQATMHNGA